MTQDNDKIEELPTENSESTSSSLDNTVSTQPVDEVASLKTENEQVKKEAPKLSLGSIQYKAPTPKPTENATTSEETSEVASEVPVETPPASNTPTETPANAQEKEESTVPTEVNTSLNALSTETSEAPPPPPPPESPKESPFVSKTPKELLSKLMNFSDIPAGISSAGLLLPQALAYSTIATLPAQAGIIALMIGLLCYGVIGRSRFALVSPTSSSALVLAAATASIAGSNAALHLFVAGGLVVAAGILFLLAAFFKIGGITDFIARPVLRGFTFGLAIVIIIKQFASAAGSTSSYDNLFYFVLYLFYHIQRWNVFNLLATFITVGLLFFALRYKKIPGGILVIILGIIVASLVDLPKWGIPLVGDIRLDTMTFNIPMMSLPEWLNLFQLSFAMVFILYAESYGSIRNFAMKHNDPVDSNRDLLALGIANLVSGLFQGMPVGAGYSATAAHEALGAKTRFAGIISLIITVLIVLTALSYIEMIPKAVLAGIVIYTMLIVIKPSSFKVYMEWKKDRLVALVAVLAVLILGVLPGLGVAVCLSLIIMLKQISASTVTELGRLGESRDYVSLSAFPEARPIKNILIVRPDLALFFANAEKTLHQIQQIISTRQTPLTTVIVSLELTNDLDTTTMESMRDFFNFVTNRHLTLVVARLKDNVYNTLHTTLQVEFPHITMTHLSVARAVNIAIDKAILRKEPPKDETLLLTFSKN